MSTKQLDKLSFEFTSLFLKDVDVKKRKKWPTLKTYMTTDYKASKHFCGALQGSQLTLIFIDLRNSKF